MKPYRFENAPLLKAFSSFSANQTNYLPITLLISNRSKTKTKTKVNLITFDRSNELEPAPFKGKV